MPSGAPTAAPTAAPVVVVEGSLGPASVRGSISVTGVPDELVEEVGQERLIQEVRRRGGGSVERNRGGG